MSETANTSAPTPMDTGISPLAGIAETIGQTHESQWWRDRQVAAVGTVMERKVPLTELRALWQVLGWSFGLQREATKPFTVRDLAARTGMTPAGVSRALNGLKGKHIIRKSAGGGWQFAPESRTNTWLVPWRIDDEEKKLAVRRVDEAQGVEFRDQRPEVGGQQAGGGKSTKNKEQQTKDMMTGKDDNANNQEMHEPHGGGSGDGVFLPTDVANSAREVSGDPLKSPPPSTMTPFNTIHNVLKGAPVVSSATQPEAEPIEGNGTEAGMEKGSPIPEDPSAYDEETLIRRLMGLLGKEIMKKKGGSLRLFIRGSLEAADCPDTAVAMRDATNETEAAQREERIKKSVFGYLYTQAFYWAGRMGWKLDAATKRWVKCKPFNTHQYRNADGRRKRFAGTCDAKVTKNDESL